MPKTLITDELAKKDIKLEDLCDCLKASHDIGFKHVRAVVLDENARDTAVGTELYEQMLVQTDQQLQVFERALLKLRQGGIRYVEEFDAVFNIAFGREKRDSSIFYNVLRETVCFVGGMPDGQDRLEYAELAKAIHRHSKKLGEHVLDAAGSVTDSDNLYQMLPSNGDGEKDIDSIIAEVKKQLPDEAQHGVLIDLLENARAHKGESKLAHLTGEQVDQGFGTGSRDNAISAKKNKLGTKLVECIGAVKEKAGQDQGSDASKSNVNVAVQAMGGGRGKTI